MGTGRKAATLEFDRERTVAIFRHLELVWHQNGSGQTGLAGRVPPELELIRALKLPDLTDQARVLFGFSKLNLSGISAKQLLNNTFWLAYRHMELFRFEQGSRVVVPKTAENQTFQFYMPLCKMRPQLPEWWSQGIVMLHDKYDDDPRQIFWQNGENRERLVKQITRDFPGIGQKIAQMTVGFFYEWSMKYDRPLFETVMSHLEPCLAIDIWWMRLVWQLGIVTHYSSTDRDQISEPISDYLSRLCREEGLDWWAIGQAMWHVGSKICNAQRALADHFMARKTCLSLCPLVGFCQGIVPANTKYIDGLGDGRSATSRGVVPWEAMVEHGEFTQRKLEH